MPLSLPTIHRMDSLTNERIQSLGAFLCLSFIMGGCFGQPQQHPARFLRVKIVWNDSYNTPSEANRFIVFLHVIEKALAPRMPSPGPRAALDLEGDLEFRPCPIESPSPRRSETKLRDRSQKRRELLGCEGKNGCGKVFHSTILGELMSPSAMLRHFSAACRASSSVTRWARWSTLYLSRG